MEPSEGSYLGGRRRSDIERYLAATPALLFLLDMEGVIFYISGSVPRYLGAGVESLIGRKPSETALPPGLHQLLTDRNQNVLRTGRSERGEALFPTALGERWFQYDLSPVYDCNGEIEGSVAMILDIIERRRSEEMLMASEARCRSLIDSMSEGLTLFEPIYDEDGTFIDFLYLDMNPAQERLIGRKREEIIGRRFTEVFGPIEHYWLEVFGKVSKSSESERFEGYDAARDRYYETFSWRPAEGQIAVIATDITRRKRLEEKLLGIIEELEESHRTLNAILEYVPEGITITGGPPDFPVKIVSSYSLRMVAKPPDKLLGISVGKHQGAWGLTLSNGSTPRPEQMPLYRAVHLGEETKNMEFLLHSADGRFFPVLVSAAPIRDADGRIVGAINVWRDISEIKEVQRAEGEERARLQTVLETTPVGIAFAEVPSGRLLYANEELWRLYKLGPQAVPSTESYAIFKLFHEDGRPYIPEDYPLARAAKGEIVRGLISSIVRGDGTHGYVATNAAPIRDPTGKITAVVGTSMDITELRETQDMLQEEKARAELYLDLLTHDISNYNTAAMGYLQLVETRLRLDERDRKLLDAPLRELRSSSELIANVRDIQKVEAGRKGAELINVCKMLEEIKRECEDSPGRQVKIILKEEDRCVIMASNLLRDAFTNIIDNAIKHSSGPLCIDITLRPVSTNGDEYLRIDFEDNGPGIPDGMKERLFARSVRGPTKAVGHGLGLYLVKRLVEEHGGKVWAEDRIAGDHTRGSRFVVLLPASLRNEQ